MHVQAWNQLPRWCQQQFQYHFSAEDLGVGEEEKEDLITEQEKLGNRVKEKSIGISTYNLCFFLLLDT